MVVALKMVVKGCRVKKAAADRKKQKKKRRSRLVRTSLLGEAISGFWGTWHNESPLPAWRQCPSWCLLGPCPAGFWSGRLSYASSLGLPRSGDPLKASLLWVSSWFFSSPFCGGRKGTRSPSLLFFLTMACAVLEQNEERVGKTMQWLLHL